MVFIAFTRIYLHLITFNILRTCELVLTFLFIMIVKPVTMAEMKRTGSIPKSPSQVHQEHVGKGNFSRFKHLQDKRDRS
jgi:hypothetical protein